MHLSTICKFYDIQVSYRKLLHIHYTRYNTRMFRVATYDHCRIKAT